MRFGDYELDLTGLDRAHAVAAAELGLRRLTTGAEDVAEAERLYQALLPLIVFLIAPPDNFIPYGKHLAARRMGLGTVHARAPAMPVTGFGLECLERYAAHLGPLDTASWSVS